MKTVIIFKDRLQLLRKQAGLQQKELAAEIGMSANAISMMETGNRETSFEKLAALAEFFHVSTDYLLGVANAPDETGDMEITTDTKQIFGMRLRQLRLEAGLQQKELGEQLGLSNNAVGMMERGNRGTTIEKVVLLAKFFHVSTDYLLGITDDPTWRGGGDGKESL